MGWAGEERGRIKERHILNQVLKLSILDPSRGADLFPSLSEAPVTHSPSVVSGVKNFIGNSITSINQGGGVDFLPAKCVGGRYYGTYRPSVDTPWN